ncbi:MAG: hypothetical protein IMW99_03805 [Firmicutes bacterium]|nr:hypothetical protein [Bacillota bacterium]
MTKRKAPVAGKTDNQLSLFDALVREAAATAQDPAAGSMNQATLIRAGISEAIRKSGMKRWEIAGRISELTGCEVTESMLNAWSAESRDDRRFPAELLAAFCYVTGDRELLRTILQPLGCHLFETEQAVMAELGRITVQKQQLSAKERQLREYLSKMR